MSFSICNRLRNKINVEHFIGFFRVVCGEVKCGILGGWHFKPGREPEWLISRLSIPPHRCLIPSHLPPRKRDQHSPYPPPLISSSIVCLSIPPPDQSINPRIVNTTSPCVASRSSPRLPARSAQPGTPTAPSLDQAIIDALPFKADFGISKRVIELPCHECRVGPSKPLRELPVDYEPRPGETSPRVFSVLISPLPMMASSIDLC